MKYSNGFGNPIVIADIPKKGCCKIIFNENGVITKALIGTSKDSLFEVYSSCTPDFCWRDAMNEMINISPSCFIEMFNELKSDEQIEYARYLAAKRAPELVCNAKENLKVALILDSIAQNS